MHVNIQKVVYLETPDIRWAALTGEEDDAHGEEEPDNHDDEHEGYDFDAFKDAVTKGKQTPGWGIAELFYAPMAYE